MGASTRHRPQIALGGVNAPLGECIDTPSGSGVRRLPGRRHHLVVVHLAQRAVNPGEIDRGEPVALDVFQQLIAVGRAFQQSDMERGK